MEKEKGTLRPAHGILLFAAATVVLISAGGFFSTIFGFCGSAVTESVFLLLTILAVVLFRVSPKEAFPLRVPTGWEIIGGITFFAGAYCAITAVGTAQNTLFPDSTAAILTDSVKSISPVASVIVLAVVPAVCEELMFRGFLLSSLKSTGKPAAVIITGLLFGIFHIDILRLLPAAIMGAAFAYIAFETESVILPMVFHFINNLAAVGSLYSDATTDTGKTLSASQTLVFCLICAVLTAVLITAGLLIFRKKKSH